MRPQPCVWSFPGAQRLTLEGRMFTNNPPITVACTGGNRVRPERPKRLRKHTVRHAPAAHLGRDGDRGGCGPGCGPEMGSGAARWGGCIPRPYPQQLPVRFQTPLLGTGSDFHPGPPRSRRVFPAGRGGSRTHTCRAAALCKAAPHTGSAQLVGKRVRAGL